MRGEKKNVCMRSQSLESSGDSLATFLHTFGTLCAFSPLPSHFRETTLYFDVGGIMKTSCYTRLKWHCYLELPFGSALDFHCTFHVLFIYLFLPRNRFVIRSQGVQCDWVCLGRFSKSKVINVLAVCSICSMCELAWKFRKTVDVFMVWFGFAANINIVSWLLQNELGWAC